MRKIRLFFSNKNYLNPLLKKHGDLRFKGFTLIELMVVMSIMSIIGIVAFVNFRTLQKDQALNSAANDLVAFLRTAQTNAKAAVKCDPSTDVKTLGWTVYIDANKKDFRSYCYTTTPPGFGTGTVQKTFSLNNTTITVDSIVAACGVFPMQVEFSPLYGDVKYRTGLNTYATCTNALEIKLRNTAGTEADTKSVIINTGGAIDVL